MAKKNVEKEKINGKLIATRHLDDLGRVVVPRMICDECGWGERTYTFLTMPVVSVW